MIAMSAKRATGDPSTSSKRHAKTSRRNHSSQTTPTSTPEMPAPYREQDRLLVLLDELDHERFTQQCPPFRAQTSISCHLYRTLRVRLESQTKTQRTNDQTLQLPTPPIPDGIEINSSRAPSPRPTCLTSIKIQPRKGKTTTVLVPI